MTRVLMLACALALPLAAQADDGACRHSDPRQLTLDMDGVSRVMFDVGPHKLRLDASPGAEGALSGRACASSADWLESLKVEQRRDGDRLHVRLYRDSPMRGIFLGRTYARLDLAGSIPDSVLVQLQVGSGDAWVTGASAMSADVGSGDGRASIGVVDESRESGRGLVGLTAGKNRESGEHEPGRAVPLAHGTNEAGDVSRSQDSQG